LLENCSSRAKARTFSPRKHPIDDPELERPAEDTVRRFRLGHPFSFGELSLIFRVSLSGCTPVERTRTSKPAAV
jgi:hypothetical protein